MSERFVVGRGHQGSVSLRDTLRGRLVATFYRDWETHGYRTEKADQVTRDMADICADALNAKHEEALARAKAGAQ